MLYLVCVILWVWKLFPQEATVSQIKAFEMWLNTRVVYVPWAAQKPNDEVSRTAKVGSDISISVKCRDWHIWDTYSEAAIVNCITIILGI